MMRSKWRRWGLAATAACAAGVLPAFLPQAGVAKSDSWVVKELKNPSGWPKVAANSINRRGRIAGFRNDGTVSRAIVWPDADSDPIELEELPGTEWSWGGLMTDRGRLAGYSSGHTGVIDWHAVIWDRHGAIATNLHDALPEGEYAASEAWQINKRGDAMGIAYTTSSFAKRAILWPRKGPAVTLGFDGAVYKATAAYALNDRGTVCGYAALLPSARPLHAAYWPAGDGAMVDLHPKVTEAMPTAVASVALEVLNNGMIAGDAWEPFTTDVIVQKAWLYDPRDDSIRLLDDGGATLATVWAGAPGNGKRLLGYLDDDYVLNGWNGAVRPALWERSRADGEMVWNLTVLPVPEGLVGFGLWACNTRGDLVGAGKAEDGTLHAFHVSR